MEEPLFAAQRGSLNPEGPSQCAGAGDRQSQRWEGASRQGSLASPASPISSVGNGCIYSELRVPVLTPRVPRGSSHCPLRWCPMRWCGWQPGQGTSRPSLHSLSLSTALGSTGPETTQWGSRRSQPRVHFSCRSGLGLVFFLPSRDMPSSRYYLPDVAHLRRVSTSAPGPHQGLPDLLQFHLKLPHQLKRG